MTDPFDHDLFLIEQKLAPVANLYRVFPAAADGGRAGPLIGFARQKKLALKEQIRIFADEDERDEVMAIRARRRIDIGGRYDVLAPDDAPIAVLERRARRSLVKTQWAILSAGDEEEVAWAEERSVGIALARRAKAVVSVIPMVDLLDLVPIPYHFVIRRGSEEVGGIRRIYGFRDRYLLDLAGDPARAIDRRAVVALGIALDALQSR